MKTTFLTFFCFFFFCVVAAYAECLEGCEEHIRYGIPASDATLLCRTGYGLSHDPEKKGALWVAYHLTREKLAGTHPRSNDFRADPDLPSGERLELNDYRSSGFDRSHLAPVADMQWDARAMSESFLSSFCRTRRQRGGSRRGTNPAVALVNNSERVLINLSSVFLSD